MITITNQELYNAKVVDVEVSIETFVNFEMNSFKGDVEIETVDNGRKIISGEHGLREYEDEFGFVINNF